MRIIGIRGGVSKGVEDGRRLPAQRQMVVGWFARKFSPVDPGRPEAAQVEAEGEGGLGGR
jgi:hypothetical protein